MTFLASKTETLLQSYANERVVEPWRSGALWDATKTSIGDFCAHDRPHCNAVDYFEVENDFIVEKQFLTIL